MSVKECKLLDVFLLQEKGYDLLFAYYYLLNLGLSVANPISALFSKDIRCRVLFNNVEFSTQRHTYLS